MALDITAQHREYSAVAQLDGQTEFLRDIPRRRIGFDSERSAADLALLNVPSYGGGEDGTVDYGWNGESVRFFTGLIHTPAAASPSIDRSVRLMDKLGLLIQKSFTDDITWSSRDFDDAVRDVLTGVGVASSDIAYIYDPGITLGGTYSITIGKNESPAEVFRQLMEYGGTKAIVYPSGKIYILDVSGIPTARYAKLPSGEEIIYAFGASGDELPMIEASWTLETIENPVVNVTITGPTRSDGVTPSGNAVLSGQSGRPWSRQYRFVQDATTADTIADRELSERAVPRRMVGFRADANPYLMPGMTIGFRDETVGITTTTAGVVWSVAIDGEVMTVSLVLGLHIIDGPTTLLPPVAVPTIITIEKQLVIIAGSTVVRYFVQMDGSASYDPDGNVQTYAWTATGATPSSSSEVKPLFVYVTLDGSQQITLTVTDDLGQTNAVTVTLPASTDSSIVRRQLLIAEGTTGLTFLNDGETFQTFPRAGQSCTAVPAINEKGTLISGWDDGAIYKINDERTAIESLTTLAGGQINALWVNEGDANNILAGAGSKLYQASDGATYVLRKDVGATINDCQNSPANVNEVRVAAGQYLKLSFDGGVTFSDVITGAAGTTARMIATAPWGHACVFIGGAATADAIKFEEGYTVDWSDVASPPTALRTITALLDTQGFVVGDGGGKLYKLLWDGSGFDATDIATISGTPSIDDGIRDGKLSGLHFYATTDGTRKLVNLATIYDVRNTAAIQIGYGAIGRYVVPGTVELLCLTKGIASGGVGHYVPGVGWTLKNSGLPTGVIYGRWVAGNPFNADEWLLLINTSNNHDYKRTAGAIKCNDSTTDPLWYTADSGATFTAVSLTLDASFADLGINQVEFSTTTDGNWFLVGRRTSLGDDTGFVVRGTDGAQTSSFIDLDWKNVWYGIAGFNDAIIVSEEDSPGLGTAGRMGIVFSGASDITVWMSYFNVLYQFERGAGLSPRLFGANQTVETDRLFFMEDYRSAIIDVGLSYAPITDPPIAWVTSVANGDVFCGGDSGSSYRRSTILKCTNFSQGGAGTGCTQTAVTTALAAPERVGMIRAGRQKRIAVAARIIATNIGGGQKDFWVSSDQGATWTRLAGPSFAGTTEVENRVEVLERGG